MTRALGLAFSFIAASLASASCGLGGGGGSCDPACTGEKTGCPQLATNLSALSALHAGQPLAQTILGAAPRWMVALAGVKITRDGLPSQEPDVTSLLGQEVKLYTGGWVFKLCDGMSEVVFGAGPETSTAQKGCGTINCAAQAETVEPRLDSPAAIAAAFPDDPVGTLYDLSFAPAATGGKRLWTVTKRPSGPAVKIDADTGAVVP